MRGGSLFVGFHLRCEAEHPSTAHEARMRCPHPSHTCRKSHSSEGPESQGALTARNLSQRLLTVLRGNPS